MLLQLQLVLLDLSFYKYLQVNVKLTRSMQIKDFYLKTITLTLLKSSGQSDQSNVNLD